MALASDVAVGYHDGKSSRNILIHVRVIIDYADCARSRSQLWRSSRCVHSSDTSQEWLQNLLVNKVCDGCWVRSKQGSSPEVRIVF
jgi:hypothetical protein